MSERIVGLSSDYVERPPAGLSRRIMAPFIPARYRPRRPVAVALSAELGASLSAGEIGESFGRLASMVLASKLASGDAPLWPHERERLLKLAAVPEPFASHDDLTNLVFFANSDQLGKGGVIGSVTSAVSSAVNVVAKGVSTVQQKVDAGLKMAAPLVAAVPGIGPAAANAMNIVANQGDILAKSSPKGLVSLVAHPLDTIAKITGGVVGAGASVAGSVVQGVAALPGDIASGAEWAYDKVSGVIGEGSSILQEFGSSAWGAIESSNPSLSGELTSLFKGTGSAYSTFASTFDNWSSSLKGAAPGSYLGKIGGEFYSMAKDAAGHFSLTKHPASVIPSSIANQLSEGNLAPIASNLFAAAAKAGASPQLNTPSVQGVPINAAGVSIPGGPAGSAIATDQTSMNLISSLVSQLIGAKATPQGTVAPTRAAKAPAAAAPQLASVPWWALLGIGLAGVAFVVKGGVQLGPDHRPRYTRRR